MQQATVCRLCERPKVLVQSHIFSNLLYKPVYGEYGQYTVVDPENKRTAKEQGGLREPLLCKTCEGKRSRWENYAKYFLFNKTASTWEKIGSKVYKVSGLNYSKLKLFVLSTLWMISVANSMHRAAQTSLGRHEEQIRQMLLNETPGQKDHYAVLLRKIKENIGTGVMLADALKCRIEGHNCYYMVFGGYAWYVLVTSHKLNQTLQSAILNEEGVALVSLMSLGETGAVEAVKQIPSVD